MEQRIRKQLGETHVVGRTLHCFDVLDSTNTYLKTLALEGAENGTVAVAAHQTAGRGRMERSFQSPEGGLYLSVLLRPELPPERLLPVPQWAGLLRRGLWGKTGVFRRFMVSAPEESVMAVL